MFIISCYFDEQKSIIGETINSIRKFHPKEKIIICDSDSPDKSYAQKYICNYVEFFDAKNKRRPIGALLETYKKYPNEPYYVLIHDSCSLVSSIQNFIDRDEELISFFQTTRTISTIPSDKREVYFNWMEKLFSKLSYELKLNFKEDEFHSLVVGCMGIYKKSLLEKFIKNGVYESMESHSFYDSCWAERAIGYIAKIEGIDLKKSCVEEGDALSMWYDMPTGSLPYIKKICFGR